MGWKGGEVTAVQNYTLSAGWLDCAYACGTWKEELARLAQACDSWRGWRWQEEEGKAGAGQRER